MSGEYIIYGLIDPVSLLIRYIGKSIRGVSRAMEHRHGGRSGSYTRRWVKSLQNSGLDYSVTILEEVQIDDINSREQWWIAYGRTLGWPLTNLTDGGDGGKGLKLSEEAKKKIGAANRNPSPEKRLKMSLAAKNRSPETRALISKIHTGMKHTEATKAKIAEINRNRPPEVLAKLSYAANNMSDETKAKIGRAALGNKYHLGHKQSEEARAKMRLAWGARKQREKVTNEQ